MFSWHRLLHLALSVISFPSLNHFAVMGSDPETLHSILIEDPRTVSFLVSLLINVGGID